jgi:hypothetical protein
MTDTPGAAQSDHLPDADQPENPELEPLGEERQGGAGIADRVGRNPANLGDDVPDMGDVTHPPPDIGDGQI